MQVQIGTLRLEHPIFNASGPRTQTETQLHAVANSRSAAIVSKTCTLLPQHGNPTPRLCVDEYNNSMNCEGLPNLGIRYYAKLQFRKPYIVSILATEETIGEMCQILQENNFGNGVELNFGCPNAGKVIGYDVDMVDRILAKIQNWDRCIGVKLPGFYDACHAKSIIQVINKYKISFITIMNTLKCYSPVLQQFAGLGGPSLKSVALANVRWVSQLLVACGRPDIAIVGVGGIHTGQDVKNMLESGATAVQVGTTHLVEGPDCFERILLEWEAVRRSRL